MQLQVLDHDFCTNFWQGHISFEWHGNFATCSSKSMFLSLWNSSLMWTLEVEEELLLQIFCCTLVNIWFSEQVGQGWASYWTVEVIMTVSSSWLQGYGKGCLLTALLNVLRKPAIIEGQVFEVDWKGRWILLVNIFKERSDDIFALIPFLMASPYWFVADDLAHLQQTIAPWDWCSRYWDMLHSCHGKNGSERWPW